MDMRNIMDLIEDAPTNGMLPAQDLMRMLPAVDILNDFTTALQKIENGQEDALTLQEKTQLSNAFISLIKLPDAQKTLVIQKMMPVTQPPAPQKQGQQPRPQGQPQRL
jgi:hypothetical protein